MKTILLIILLALVFLLPFLSEQADAICLKNEDWPKMPCYGCPFCYPGTARETLDWAQYYDFKGNSLMETKKLEMNQAIQSGTLSEWTTVNSTNHENHNVWTYYYFKGEAPSHEGKFVYEDQLPPLKQFGYEVTLEKISCNQDLVVMKKLGNGQPACVSIETFQKLSERGWGTTYFEDMIQEKETENSIKFTITDDAEVVDIVFDLDANSVKIKTKPISGGYLTIELPRTLFDPKWGLCGSVDPDAEDDRFFVLVDGEEVYYLETVTTDQYRTLLIQFSENTLEIEIIETCLA